MAKAKKKAKKVTKDRARTENPFPTLEERDVPLFDDPLKETYDRMEAIDLENKASEELKIPEEDRPPLGAGGEFGLRENCFDEIIPNFINTVEKPNYLTEEASRDRLELTSEVNCMNLALDAAETIQAKNSLEKMLAHQMSAAHKLAMKFARNALEHSSDARSNIYKVKEFHSVEAARAANASARMMDSFQKGLLALAKVRSGGMQTVTVQHVNVKDGGQAVVTGAYKTRGSDET